MSTDKPFTTGCKVCGRETGQYGSRGLCQMHYRQFKTKLESFDDDEQATKFEEEAIRLGWVLPKTGGGRPKSWSPFDEIAQRIAEKPSEFESEPKTLESIKPEIDRFVNKAVAKRKSTKASGSTKNKGAQ